MWRRRASLRVGLGAAPYNARVRVYLDHNATTFPLPEVWEKVGELQSLALGNPSSIHQEGRLARRLVEEARNRVAALLGASPQEVVFTSGGTEANNMALWGLTRALGGPNGVRLYLGATEHPSVFSAAEALASLGAQVDVLPVDRQGLIRREVLSEVRPPAVVCVQLANHETGVLQPVSELVAEVSRPGVLVHCDAVQAVGKVALSFRELGVHTLALSGHKIGGLPGVGALLVREGLELPAFIPGEQELRRRGGTEPLVAIHALGWACHFLQERLGLWAKVGELRDHMEHILKERIADLVIFGQGVPRVANTSCLGLPTPLLGNVAVAALDLEGFAVSSGPACSSGASLPSAVVRAMGFDDWAARTLRVSLGLTTQREEIELFAEALEKIVARSR